jgi:hypothetical protein
MLEELRRDVIALGASLELAQIEDIHAHFRHEIVYDAHVRVYAKRSTPLFAAIAHSDWPVFCVDMQSTILAPHLLETFLSTRRIAQAYFDREEPVLYSMNTFWTQPSTARYEDTHDWHRDGDDRKQLVVFIYGTDVVKPEQGAHLYQPGTQHKNDEGLGYPYRHPPENAVRTILGRAGTVFCSDTRGLHMGCRPTNTRMLMWGRWGVSTPPESYKWDKLQPTPAGLLGARYTSLDDDERHAIRFVVQ